MRDVAQGDAEEVAQDIWDRHAESLDAARGDFTITIARMGFPVDWEPVQ
jgi:hypothetical protein